MTGRTPQTDDCACIEAINKELKQYNAEILVNLFGPPRAVVETYTSKKIRGKKTPYVMASYCPFCGVKYKREGDAP